MFRDFDRADWGFFVTSLSIVTADRWWGLSLLLILIGTGLMAARRR